PSSRSHRCRPRPVAHTLSLAPFSSLAVSRGTPMSTSRQRLLELFKARAVSFGRFTLASGKESTYYINSKKVLFHAEAIWLLGDVLWEMTKDLDIQAIGGLEVGAIPMATAACLRY